MLLRGKGSLAIFALLAAVGSAPATAADCPKYEGRVALESVSHLPEYQNAGPYDPGDYEKKLLEDLTFVDCDGTRYTAKKGTVVNGASIPRAAWSALGYTPWSGKLEKPAIIHDDQCERVMMTSEKVHSLFHDGLVREGVSAWDAGFMYGAVRAFGPQWTEPGGKVHRPSWKEGVWNGIQLIRQQMGLKVMTVEKGGKAFVTLSPVRRGLKLDGSANDRKKIDEMIEQLQQVDQDIKQLNLGGKFSIKSLGAGNSLSYTKPLERQ
ncbi:MAG: hypothetical protein RLZ98_2517 [Pseudomonadota bacterium]|jgi:hypothetical protein